MRRVVNAVALALLIVVVVAGAYAGYLATSNPAPRHPAEAGWVPVKPMPGARGAVAMAVVRRVPNGPRLCAEAASCPDVLVYVAGGVGGALNATTATVQTFDPPAAAWRAGPSLPEPRNHAAAAGLGDTLYVTGGSRHSFSGKPEANVWVLRPGRRSFDRLPNMPEPRTGHAMVEVRGKLYVVGGAGGSAVLVFDPGTKTWSKGAPIPVARAGVAAVAYQDRIYVIGGSGPAARHVDVYDPATDAWTSAPLLPFADAEGSAALLSDGLIHLVGGEEPSIFGGTVRDTHLVLDPVANAWITAPQPIVAVHGAGAAEVNGELLIVGGSRRQGSLSVLGWTGFAQVFAPALLNPSATPTATGSASSPKPSPKTSASKR